MSDGLTPITPAAVKPVLKTVLRYVTPPDDEQLAGITRFLEKKYSEYEIEIRLVKDKNLDGGFLLQAGADEYDYTIREKLRQLEEELKDAIVSNPVEHVDDIIPLFDSKIESFETHIEGHEVGAVTFVGDGIAVVSGVQHAEYGEILVFDTGQKAMVQDLKPGETGCILFGKEGRIVEGTRVARTGKTAGMPVGKAFLGRVVNALGEPLDERGEIEAEDYFPVERPAPGIMERQSVSVPMETGILSIDSMFPIGRGQRELIIGDRQTGKTSIALETILNQKGKDVKCIYVAIGQKKSTVSKLVNTLKKHGAMEYCTMVCAFASDNASLQYVAPYSATALAEFFMEAGDDVLIVYDDLSKHAVAYRTLSLLLERSPGREAYPGDVFYLHSRLLERSCRLNEDFGGGSITALPIVETQAGDVSAYIPTNVISITDGQIYLESGLFYAGMRPAVNVGLSVSRVGGAAQEQAMKKSAGSIRIDLAQYREMEVFTQFSSDLDESTRKQLVYGSGLMELLKQPLEHPMSLWEQVLTLLLAQDRFFVPCRLENIKKCQRQVLDYFAETHEDVVEEIEGNRYITDELRAQILKISRDYREKHPEV